MKKLLLFLVLVFCVQTIYGGFLGIKIPKLLPGHWNIDVFGVKIHNDHTGGKEHDITPYVPIVGQVYYGVDRVVKHYENKNRKLKREKEALEAEAVEQLKKLKKCEGNASKCYMLNQFATYALYYNAVSGKNFESRVCMATVMVDIAKTISNNTVFENKCTVRGDSGKIYSDVETLDFISKLSSDGLESFLTADYGSEEENELVRKSVKELQNKILRNVRKYYVNNITSPQSAIEDPRNYFANAFEYCGSGDLMDDDASYAETTCSQTGLGGGWGRTCLAAINDNTLFDITSCGKLWKADFGFDYKTAHLSRKSKIILIM